MGVERDTTVSEYSDNSVTKVVKHIIRVKVEVVSYNHIE